MTDVTIIDEYPVYLVTFNTQRAISWAGFNIAEDSTWFESKLVIEEQYIDHLLFGLKDANISIEFSN